MKSNPNGFAEPTIIGTETEAKDYVLRQETNEVSKRKLLPIHFSLECEIGCDTTKPPIPDMHYDYRIRRWMPDDVEKFAIDHKVEFERLKAIERAKYEAMWNELGPRNIRAKASESQKSPGHQEDQSSGIPSAPENLPKPATKPKVKKEKAIAEETQPLKFNSNVKSGDGPMLEPVATTEHNENISVEQSKKTRVSAKMVDADFDELSREYLQVTSLGEKKPVFLPLELRDALDAIARLSGDRRLSASHVAINVIRAFLNEHRELINRKLAGVKLSI